MTESSDELEALKQQVEKLTAENAALTEEKGDMAEELEALQGRCQKLAKAAATAADKEGENGEKDGQVEKLMAENAALLEEKAEMAEEIEALRGRCQKLAKAAAAAEKSVAEAETQTGDEDGWEGEGAAPQDPVVAKMLRAPADDAVQLQCVEALFARQTQAGGEAAGEAAVPAMQATVAIFQNHPTKQPLLLKASQFLSVLLADANVQQSLPSSTLWQAAEGIVAAVGANLLSDAPPADAKATSKLLTWFLALLTLLFPVLTPRLKDQSQSEAFVRRFLEEVLNPFLGSAEVPEENLLVKCLKLLPLLPMEAWIQKLCLESRAVHSLALVYHRSLSEPAESPMAKGVRAALRAVFSQNMELCVLAIDDTFVLDELVCLEVLDELRDMEKKQHGSFRTLDAEHGVLRKTLGLWNYHQRKALEDIDGQGGDSKLVLKKAAELISAVLLKLMPKTILQRLEEFQNNEPFLRIALAAIHEHPQLRLQLAVNYVDNGVVPIVIAGLQMLIRRYESNPGEPLPPEAAEVEVVFSMMQHERFPHEAWPYALYSLEICLHILQHWAATKLSLRQKADVLDETAAPQMFALGGLVDTLVTVVEPNAPGYELNCVPPKQVQQKASETMQQLFEQNGHICLFCMQHYIDVKHIVALGCDCLLVDPLLDFPDLQQQAADQLTEAFDKFVTSDESLGRKILKALSGLFESSYRLVVWYLQKSPINQLGELQSLDIHIEACRAVSRAAYWGHEDMEVLNDFVVVLVNLVLSSIEGHADDPDAAPKGKKRVFDLSEAEQLVMTATSAMLHVLLIDPQPPTVQRLLVGCFANPAEAGAPTPPLEDGSQGASEKAVNNMMRVMGVFPSSDKVQMNCQHLLTSFLGD